MAQTTVDRGSVLVDALVALGIIAITLTLASQALQSGLGSSTRAETGRLAELEARSRLAEAGADIPLATGRTSGVDGALAWMVDVSGPSEGGLYSVSVTVSDAQGRTLARLDSLRGGQ